MDDAATLHYRAPEGQDRVTVMTARSALGSVRTTAIDAGRPTDPAPIRFSDES